MTYFQTKSKSTFAKYSVKINYGRTSLVQPSIIIVKFETKLWFCV